MPSGWAINFFVVVQLATQQKQESLRLLLVRVLYKILTEVSENWSYKGCRFYWSLGITNPPVVNRIFAR